MGPLCCLGEALQGQVGLVSGQKWQLKLTPHESGLGPGGQAGGWLEDRRHTAEAFCENSGNVFDRMSLLWFA